jgi:hypothetical protein
MDILVASPDYKDPHLLRDMFNLCDKERHRFYCAPTGSHVLAYLHIQHRQQAPHAPISIPPEMNRYYPLVIIRHDIDFGPDRATGDRAYPRLSAGDDLAKRIQEASYGAVIVGMAPKPHFFSGNADYRLGYPPTFGEIKELLDAIPTHSYIRH